MKPQNPPQKDVMLCPECGTDKIKELENVEVKNTENNSNLKQFKCLSCNCMFIPAFISPLNENIKKWSKNVRINGNNNGKTWTDKKPTYIIIKEKL